MSSRRLACLFVHANIGSYQYHRPEIAGTSAVQVEVRTPVARGGGGALLLGGGEPPVSSRTSINEPSPRMSSRRRRALVLPLPVLEGWPSAFENIDNLCVRWRMLN